MINLNTQLSICKEIVNSLNVEGVSEKLSSGSIIDKVVANVFIKQAIDYLNGKTNEFFFYSEQMEQQSIDKLLSLEGTEQYEYLIYLFAQKSVSSGLHKNPQLLEVAAKMENESLDFSSIYRTQGETFSRSVFGKELEEISKEILVKMNESFDKNELNILKSTLHKKSKVNIRIDFAKELFKKNKIDEAKYLMVEEQAINSAKNTLSNISDRFGEEKSKEFQRFEEIGNKVIEAILNHSSISEEEADKWVESLKLPASFNKAPSELFALKDVNKFNSRELLKRFYRLTNGRIKKGVIINLINGRGYASQISSVANSPEIKIDDDVGTLFHELAHHIEFDPLAKKIANDFIKRRRTDTQTKSLKALTGINYAKNEVAFIDHFINPYVGKYYKDGSTEVFSMGVEMLSNPISTAELIAKDPDMFNTIVGFLTKENSLSKDYFNGVQYSQGITEKIQEQKDQIEKRFIASIPKYDFEKIEALPYPFGYYNASEIYGVLTNENGDKAVFFKSSRYGQKKGKQLLYAAPSGRNPTYFPHIKKGQEAIILYNWVNHGLLKMIYSDEMLSIMTQKERL